MKRADENIYTFFRPACTFTSGPLNTPVYFLRSPLSIPVCFLGLPPTMLPWVPTHPGYPLGPHPPTLGTHWAPTNPGYPLGPTHPGYPLGPHPLTHPGYPLGPHPPPPTPVCFLVSHPPGGVSHPLTHPSMLPWVLTHPPEYALVGPHPHTPHPNMLSLDPTHPYASEGGILQYAYLGPLPGILPWVPTHPLIKHPSLLPWVPTPICFLGSTPQYPSLGPHPPIN